MKELFSNKTKKNRHTFTANFKDNVKFIVAI